MGFNSGFKGLKRKTMSMCASAKFYEVKTAGGGVLMPKSLENASGATAGNYPRGFMTLRYKQLRLLNATIKGFKSQLYYSRCVNASRLPPAFTDST